MELPFRNTRVEDLSQCRELVASELVVPTATRPDMHKLVEFWEHLLANGYARSIVVQAPSLAGGKVLGFAMSACAEPTFLRDYGDCPRPYLSARLVELWEADRLPLWNREKIRRNNVRGKGVNLLGLHSTWQGKDGAAGGRKDVRDAMLASLFAIHANLEIRQFWKEIYGPAELMRYQQFGADEWRRDMPSSIACTPSQTHPLSPVFVGIRRDAALSLEGSFARQLFLSCKPPVLLLTDLRRQVGQLAVKGLTDRRIAETLVGTNDDRAIAKKSAAIRKLWGKVYDQIETLCSSELDNYDRAQVRHTVVEYLRNHPEELGPPV
jgi:hypothetical protein